MWRWTGSDLQHRWICDMRKLEVEQIYAPCLASPSCLIFQYGRTKKNSNFLHTYFIFYYSHAKLGVVSGVTTVTTMSTVTDRRRKRSSLSSCFVLILTARSTGSRLAINDGTGDKLKGASSRGIANLKPELWPLTWIIIRVLCHPGRQN